MVDTKKTQELETLLKTAKQHYQAAVSDKHKGNFQSARAFLMEASEVLLAAAALSTEGLKTSREALAQQLLEEAKTLPLVDSRRMPEKPGAVLPIAGLTEDETVQSWLIHEKPSIRFDAIAGLEEVKQQIKLKLLYPFQHPELAQTYGIKPGGGILLYGPPGTGKTMIARAVAGEMDAAFFAIKPSEIMSQWVGVAEQNLQKLFAIADTFPLSVIFMDEIESLAPKRRGSHSTVMQRVVPQLLAELDGFDQRANARLMISATNEPWSIDVALLRPGRLDRLIYVPPPDEEARKKILALNFKGKPLAEDVSLEDVARQTTGFSGADMVALVARACENAFFRAISSGAQGTITRTDIEAVLQTMHASIDPKDVKLYEKFHESR